jgi:hypothetical protein
MAGSSVGLLATVRSVREHSITNNTTLTREAAIQTAISSVDFHASFSCFTSFPEVRITLSDSGWLSCRHGSGHILLWLPVERRGEAFAGNGKRIVVGGTSGAVTVLELPTERA